MCSYLNIIFIYLPSHIFYLILAYFYFIIFIIFIGLKACLGPFLFVLRVHFWAQTHQRSLQFSPTESTSTGPKIGLVLQLLPQAYWPDPPRPYSRPIGLLGHHQAITSPLHGSCSMLLRSCVRHNDCGHANDCRHPR